MIELRKMASEEINNKPFLINHIYDLYSHVEDSFFEYTYNGETRWVYSYGKNCMIIAIDGEYIAYATFMIDDDYNLTFMEFDNFSVYRHNDGSLVLLNDGSNVSEALEMHKRGDLKENELNGIIIHRQINNKTHEEMAVAYLCVYRDSKYFFPFNFKKPFFVAFMKGKKKQKYLLYETGTDYYSYDIITLKEFGLMDFLKEGSFTLQKEDPIRRYFKVKCENKVGKCTLLYPFSHPYKIDEIDALIHNKGFTRKVSENTLGYYNGMYPERDEFYALVEAIKVYDKKIEDDIKKLSC